MDVLDNKVNEIKTGSAVILLSILLASDSYPRSVTVSAQDLLTWYAPDSLLNGHHPTIGMALEGRDFYRANYYSARPATSQNRSSYATTLQARANPLGDAVHGLDLAHAPPALLPPASRHAIARRFTLKQVEKLLQRNPRAPLLHLAGAKLNLARYPRVPVSPSATLGSLIPFAALSMAANLSQLALSAKAP